MAKQLKNNRVSNRHTFRDTNSKYSKEERILAHIIDHDLACL